MVEKSSKATQIEAMEARSVDAIPEGREWQYEPKWDGFRCLLMRDTDAVGMYSKSGQDLSGGGRYFPEGRGGTNFATLNAFILLRAA